MITSRLGNDRVESLRDAAGGVYRHDHPQGRRKVVLFTMRTDVRITHARWGVCPECGRERRIRAGVMIEHKRYESLLGEYGTMVYCYGSGYAPERVTAWHEKRNSK